MRNRRRDHRGEIGRIAVPMGRTLSQSVVADTDRSNQVTELLKRAAYLPLFSMPNPLEPDVPISPLPLLTDLIPVLSNFILIGVYVNEAPHRFEVVVEQPTPSRGLAAAHSVGQQAATINVHFAITPENFYAGPGIVPPPTLFIPFFSQRFSFPQGQFQFMDKDKSGFQGFGAGRTFPITVGGQIQIRIVGIIQILEGLGKFQGLQGIVVVNGEIKPPNELALFMMPRIMDPNGVLKADIQPPIEPLVPVADPDPTTAFLFFLSEPDPDYPITMNRAGDGRILGVNLFERLRLVRIGFDIDTPQDIRSRTIEGPVVGSHRSTLIFDPNARGDVAPLYSCNDIYTFYDQDGRTCGTLSANLVEGRAFRTQLSGVPNPVFRIGGGGPLLQGTEQFVGAQGLASVNGVVSLDPPTVSNLYMLRIIDTAGAFRVIARGEGLR